MIRSSQTLDFDFYQPSPALDHDSDISASLPLDTFKKAQVAKTVQCRFIISRSFHESIHEWNNQWHDILETVVTYIPNLLPATISGDTAAHVGQIL